MGMKPPKFTGNDTISINMADDKTYTPETIADTPFPIQEETIASDETDSSTKESSKPKTIKEVPLPMRKVAQELLSTALNTSTRKILAEFQFTPSGAIQIGNYQEGEHGDIRIAPSGILARNRQGDTTFALDSETGDAFFAGQLRSGTLITGDITLQDGASIQIGSDEGDTIIDEQGIVSANNFRIESISNNPGATFTNTSFQNISGVSTLEINVARSTKALITISVVGSSEQINPLNPADGRTNYRVFSDIQNELIAFFYDASITDDYRENIISKPYGVTGGITLNPGVHTISVQSNIASANNFRSIANQVKMTIVLLGN